MVIFRYSRSASRDNHERHHSLFFVFVCRPAAVRHLPPTAYRSQGRTRSAWSLSSVYSVEPRRRSNKIDRAGAGQLKVLGKSNGAEWEAGRHCVAPSSTVRCPPPTLFSFSLLPCSLCSEFASHLPPSPLLPLYPCSLSPHPPYLRYLSGLSTYPRTHLPSTFHAQKLRSSPGEGA